MLLHISESARMVADTAKQIDVIRPGWADQVNTKTLDLSDGSRCLLGQTGGYTGGIVQLHANFPGLVYDCVFYDNVMFRQHWINEVEKRVVVERERPYQLIPLWSETHQPEPEPVKVPAEKYVLVA